MDGLYVMLMASTGTCDSDAKALAVLVVGGVGVSMLPALGVDVGVVAAVAVAAFVAVGCAVAVSGPSGVDVGAFCVVVEFGGVAMGLLMVTLGVSAAMRGANDREGAAPATGTASSASNVTPSVRPRDYPSCGHCF